MNLKTGANVKTSDGHSAGKLSLIVINPETREITHVVVQKGLLFKTDKVIPIMYVDFAEEDEVVLNCPASELDSMAPLHIEEQVSVGNTSLDPNIGNSTITVTKRTTPEGYIAMKVAAKVLSADSEHLGNIESLTTGSETKQINQLIISEGLLEKTRRMIPIYWLKTLGENEVELAVTAQQFKEVTIVPV